MTFFQILMLGASAFFAYKIYEHIGTLQEPEERDETQRAQTDTKVARTAEAFSTFDSTDLIEKADEAMMAKDFDKALAIYSEANIKDPKNGEVLFKMGYTLAVQKRNDEALDYFREALEVDDKNPFTHLEMALVYIDDGEIASARTHLNAALEIDPDLEKAKTELEKLNAE